MREHVPYLAGDRAARPTAAGADRSLGRLATRSAPRRAGQLDHAAEQAVQRPPPEQHGTVRALQQEGRGEPRQPRRPRRLAREALGSPRRAAGTRAAMDRRGRPAGAACRPARPAPSRPGRNRPPAAWPRSAPASARSRGRAAGSGASTAMHPAEHALDIGVDRDRSRAAGDRRDRRRRVGADPRQLEQTPTRSAAAGRRGARRPPARRRAASAPAGSSPAPARHAAPRRAGPRRGWRGSGSGPGTARTARARWRRWSAAASAR